MLHRPSLTRSAVAEQYQRLAKGVTTLALLSICRQIYLESVEVYYGLNTFAFGLDEQQPYFQFYKAIGEKIKDKISSVCLYHDLYHDNPRIWTALVGLPNLTELEMRFYRYLNTPVRVRTLFTDASPSLQGYCLTLKPFCEKLDSLKHVRLTLTDPFQYEDLAEATILLEEAENYINNILNKKWLEKGKSALTKEDKV